MFTHKVAVSFPSHIQTCSMHLSPRELIEIAVLEHHDRATASTERMRVGTNVLGLINANWDMKLIVEGTKKALNVLTHR